MRIGIFSDAHYDPILYPTVFTRSQTIANIFKNEGCSLILCMGDSYDDPSLIEDYTSVIPEYESIWTDTGILTRSLIGNHDKQGIGEAAFLAISTITPAKNYTIDLGLIRFICYTNSDEPFFSASSDTLTWLTAELAKCQTGGLDEGKKIIVCTHAWIYTDYIGPGYTNNSYNAAAQRSVIEASKSAGANILAVFYGHGHISHKQTVNTINYFAFDSIDDSESFAIVDINENTGAVKIIGNIYQSSFDNDPIYYISATGSDSNSGLLRSKPYLTVGKFTANMVANKTAFVMRGDYRRGQPLPIDGVSGQPAVINFEVGAVWSGCDIITGLTLVGSEYQVALATECKVVLKNGTLLTEGTAGSLSTGQWDWVAGVLYLKDDPTGYTIEAGQRASAFEIASNTKNVIINNLVARGYNGGGLVFYGAGGTVEINKPTISGARYGIQDASTASNLITVNNSDLYDCKDHGLAISGAGSTKYRNVYSHNNKVNGIQTSSTTAPIIVGGICKSNGSNGIALATTGGSGTNIYNVISVGNTVRALNSTGAGASTITNSCINGTAVWGTTTNTNNITSDPLINSEGLLQYGSPCIDTGAWISGVGGNQSGETDRYGNKVYGIPNIGIDQKAGSPISGNRSTGKSRNF